MCRVNRAGCDLDRRMVNKGVRKLLPQAPHRGCEPVSNRAATARSEATSPKLPEQTQPPPAHASVAKEKTPKLPAAVPRRRRCDRYLLARSQAADSRSRPE